MRIFNEELNRLSEDIFAWQTKTGKSFDDAPEDIKKKVKEFKLLNDKIKKEQFGLMGIEL